MAHHLVQSITPAKACADRERFNIAERSFTCQIQNRQVPVAAWFPMTDKPSPLILVGHGGSGHKQSDFVLDVVTPLVRDNGIAIAAIDGPVHGDRRTNPALPSEVRSDFRTLWEAGKSIAPMVEDWQGAIDALCAFPEVDTKRIGYYGLSMGTAYGLPLLAVEHRIRVAVIGMWGTSRSGSQQLVDAARAVSCPTKFCIQWNDELFTREGQFELFDALSSERKHVAIHPGGHINPAADRLDEIVYFFSRELTARET